MQPRSKKFLADAMEAADLITQFVHGRGFEEMASDKLFRSAVYFQFAVIGEALAQVRTIDLATFERLTDCHRIVGFRNRILHGYGEIQDNVTWQIIQEQLPLLRGELNKLLAE